MVKPTPDRALQSELSRPPSRSVPWLRPFQAALSALRPDLRMPYDLHYSFGVENAAAKIDDIHGHLFRHPRLPICFARCDLTPHFLTLPQRPNPEIGRSERSESDGDLTNNALKADSADKNQPFFQWNGAIYAEPIL